MSGVHMDETNWREPEKFMLAGWRRDMDDMVSELDKWVPPGSYLTLFNRHPVSLQLMKLAMGGLELPGDDVDSESDAAEPKLTRHFLQYLPSFQHILLAPLALSALLSAGVF